MDTDPFYAPLWGAIKSLQDNQKREADACVMRAEARKKAAEDNAAYQQKKLELLERELVLTEKELGVLKRQLDDEEAEEVDEIKESL